MQQFVRNKLKKKFLEEGYCIFNIGDDKLIDKKKKLISKYF